MSVPSIQSCHPRRRPIKGQVSPISIHTMSLRRSGTFSSPHSLSDELCDPGNQSFMPRRSPTDAQSLELLLAHDSSVRRVTDLLKDFDQKLASHQAASTTGASILNDAEVLPVPSFLLDHTTLDNTAMEIDPKPCTAIPNHEHASDSGLGSSISGSKYDGRRCSVGESIRTSASSTRSAVTHSLLASSATEEKHTLGEHACKQIHDYIIKPILAEDSLKDFHPLIQDVPRRIGEKNICNLRDLEKTLVFLAPVSGIRSLSQEAKAYYVFCRLKELSATSASYLRFCERSIQLLRTTVEYLSEPDQRLPSDRPYTNNYFLDLIEQIRRYAAIMAATREKVEKGEALDDTDHSRYDRAAAFLFSRVANQARNSEERITVRGGLSHNGRPLELVREKNGRVLPIAERFENIGNISKRALSADELDQDEAIRSMARRRRSEKPGDVVHACRDCNREFKRPCDLTKHEKTHSRPWKCTEAKCKYFEFGWPTEKERDRHMNDKHSAAPAQYKCLYPPCAYASKRESNCKQHMEKAHGWQYVRSKNNGRIRPIPNIDRSPVTPLTPFLDTPQSAVLTPMTPFAPSPMLHDFEYRSFGPAGPSIPGCQDGFRRDSITTNLTYSSGHSPIELMSFQGAITPEDLTVNHDDFSHGCTSAADFQSGFQQSTPAVGLNMDSDSFLLPTNAMTAGLSPFSPLAQHDLTLFPPSMPMDEGFAEMDVSQLTRDFTLFDPPAPSSVPFTDATNFFPEFAPMGGLLNTFYVEPTPQDHLECMPNEEAVFNLGMEEPMFG